jgi:hypothetical protein
MQAEPSLFNAIATRRLARALLLGALCAAGAAQAQRAAPGEVTTTLNATVLGQTGTDLDGGGSFDWVGANVGVNVKRQFTPALSLGFSAAYGSENWSFDTPGAFGPVAPWGNVLRPSIGLSLGYALAPDLSMFIAPQLEWSYESGASASDGQNYGAVLGVNKVFSPTLFAGIGLGVFRQIDEMRYFPFFIVNWQITDQWRLANPVQAGPAGGAGLELSYAFGDGWELAGGAAYRDYRFRLRSDAPVPNGLGRNTGIPVFAKLTRKFGPAAQISLYAGVVANGQLRVLDASGSTVQESDYGTSPLIALSGSFEF